MAAPEIEIDVDRETGIWSVAGLPMILLPRHFLMNMQRMMQAELGRARFERTLHEAGRRSAYEWCEADAAHHGTGGLTVFRSYLDSLSRRGWGQFELTEVEPATGRALVRVRHSAFTSKPADEPACGMFTGWFVGAMQYVADTEGGLRDVQAREVRCAAPTRGEVCEFVVEPLTVPDPTRPDQQHAEAGP